MTLFELFRILNLKKSILFMIFYTFLLLKYVMVVKLSFHENN